MRNSNKEILRKQRRSLIKRSIPYYWMLLPGVLFVLLFNYLPLYGYKIAFQKFVPVKGFFGEQQWRGMYYFNFILKSSDFQNAFRNTITISFTKLIFMAIAAILFSILLNEVQNSKIKRTVQTVVYFPHFLSWIILSYVFIDILSIDGMMNRFLGIFGIEPIFFLGSNKWFPTTLVVTDVWKEFGFNSIVYLAAITSIDPSLYESAVIDGASRFKQTINITLPGILPTIMLVTLLNIGGVMNANFDQVYNLYSPTVYASGDVLDTLIYRIGLVQTNYSMSTAVSLFKSVVSMGMVGTCYYLAYRFAGYRIF